MTTLRITAAKNSGNVTTFDLVDTDGTPVDLTALGATVVTVSVCDGRYSCGAVKIDSDGGYVSFSGNTLSVAFGKLQLAPAQAPYSPKVSYITSSNPDEEVIAGKGYETQIQLTAVC